MSDTSKANGAKFKIRMRYVIFVAIALIVLGFFYEIMFAGIPYQDPPPELLEAYNRNHSISEIIILIGFGLLFIGLLAAFFKKLLAIKLR